MMRKSTIANVIFTIAVLYIISPYFFERKLLFNEILSAIGFLLLVSKRFRIDKDHINIAFALLLGWGAVHAIVSLARMDSLYFYFRNLVILYSMMGFFIGYYLFRYLGAYIKKIRSLLRAIIGVFIFIPLPRILFERFGVAMLFPALFKNAAAKSTSLLLIAMCIIYAFVYSSSTSALVAMFFMLLFISPGYRFFMQTMFCVFVAFTVVFIYLHPNLALISYKFTFFSENPIYNVIRSHPLLSIDGNSTWRLVLWNELIVDDFPGNLFGLGFGTSALKYYPVEDYAKLDTLAYVLGGHNSYIYLFARLGIVYVFITLYIYGVVFKEYFYHKKYYLANNEALIFWSFFIMSIIAMFNPALETPIYASAYWMLLGFTARAIHNRKMITRIHENTVRS